MSVPHGLLGKAYARTFFALAMIALIAALLFAPPWVQASIICLAVIAFGIWQPNHGGG